LIIADKLPTTLATAVILFAVAFFSVSGYVGIMAMGALDFYGYCHNFIVFPCVPVVITPFSYFVDHHPIIQEGEVPIRVHFGCNERNKAGILFR
jgi:hypothetical protein